MSSQVLAGTFDQGGSCGGSRPASGVAPALEQHTAPRSRLRFLLLARLRVVAVRAFVWWLQTAHTSDEGMGNVIPYFGYECCPQCAATVSRLPTIKEGHSHGHTRGGSPVRLLTETKHAPPRIASVLPVGALGLGLLSENVVYWVAPALEQGSYGHRHS